MFHQLRINYVTFSMLFTSTFSSQINLQKKTWLKSTQTPAHKAQKTNVFNKFIYYHLKRINYRSPTH